MLAGSHWSNESPLGVMMSSRPGVASVSRVRAPGAMVLLFTW